MEAIKVLNVVDIHYVFVPLNFNINLTKPEQANALFSRDLKKNGALHEYYEPDTGEPIINKGFQNWNYLVLNMIEWIQGKLIVEEF